MPQPDEFLRGREAQKIYCVSLPLYPRFYFDFGKPTAGTHFADALPTLIKVARG